MSDFQGMDTDGARGHAARLTAGARGFRTLGSDLDRSIAAVSWSGPDAEEFHARWSEFQTGRLQLTVDHIEELSARLLAEADEQDVVSEQDGTETGPAHNPSTLPAGPPASGPGGYLSSDIPWLPDVIENPLESFFSDSAQNISDLVGRGFDLGMDTLIGAGDHLGIRMDGFEQFRRDAEHWGDSWTDILTGERVPTFAELAAGGILTVGSAGNAVYEAVTGEDSAFLDDRPGGIVHSVETSTDPSQSPQTLQDLVLDNNSLRMDNPDQGPLEAGQIGIQQVQSSEGGEPVYIVQVPPTEGAGIGEVPDAYGGQGNSRDWGSNLRLVAGQHPAAMDDVEAAMSATGPDGNPLVPPGANVMFVGHSQGGIVATHLAADPSFNNTSGDPGSYNVTHSFSVGSPVQTVLPAQGSTEVVNVTHGPLTVQGGQASGDPIADLDLQGARPAGGPLQAPNVHEVVLPGISAPVGMPWLEANHDSVGQGNDPSGGYAGTVAQNAATDPTLAALQADTTGVYLGQGTVVTESSVVTVGREDLT